MILQVKEMIQTAEAISNYGFLVVVCAVFIVLAFMVFFFTVKKYNKLLDNNEQRYKNLLDKLTGESSLSDVIQRIETLVESTQDLISPIQRLVEVNAESTKEECTFAQASRVIRTEIKSTRAILVDSVKQVVKQNNVHANPAHTRSKINKIVCNCIIQMRQGLDLFKFNGVKLTYNLQTEKISESLSDIIYKFVMSTDSKDYDRLSGEIDIILDATKAEIRQNIGVL